MAVQELGVLDGPVLVFGGPYSNLQATRAMRAEAHRLGIPPQRVICSGDIIAYGADPEATLALIRDWGIPVVMGNCEQSLAADAEDCGCGFALGSACDLLSVSWYRYARQRMDHEARRWMGALPRRIRFTLAGHSVTVIHGGVDDISRFIFASTPPAVKIEEQQRCGTDLVIGGHCGLPFGQKLGRGAWLNAGVIGMPANDGTGDGWYLLLEPLDGGLRCRWHRLEYSSAVAKARMEVAGLAGGYAESLASGLWPSEDVLPEAERAGRVVRLTVPDLWL